MSKISLEEVKKLAGLARIVITDEEALKFQKEMEAILEYVQMLDEIDTTGVEPTSQVTGLVNVTRPDEVTTYGVDRAGLLANVPETKDSYIKVKKVL